MNAREGRALATFSLLLLGVVYPVSVALWDGKPVAAVAVFALPLIGLLGIHGYWRFKFDATFRTIWTHPSTIAQLAILLFGVWSGLQLTVAAFLSPITHATYMVDHWRLQPLGTAIAGLIYCYATVRLLVAGPFASLPTPQSRGVVKSQVALHISVVPFGLFFSLWGNDPFMFFATFYVPLPLIFLAVVAFQRDDTSADSVEPASP